MSAAARNIFGPHDGSYSLYVAGFLFRNQCTEVALVTKSKPAWQAGWMNGIGGKVEPGETIEDAIRREFREETGADIQAWRHVCHLRGKDWSVVFFTSQDEAEIRTMEDEPVDWYTVDDLSILPVIRNLRWLIPMALDPSMPVATVIDSN